MRIDEPKMRIREAAEEDAGEARSAGSPDEAQDDMSTRECETYCSLRVQVRALESLIEKIPREAVDMARNTLAAEIPPPITTRSTHSGLSNEDFSRLFEFRMGEPVSS